MPATALPWLWQPAPWLLHSIPRPRPECAFCTSVGPCHPPPGVPTLYDDFQGAQHGLSAGIWPRLQLPISCPLHSSHWIPASPHWRVFSALPPDLSARPSPCQTDPCFPVSAVFRCVAVHTHTRTFVHTHASQHLRTVCLPYGTPVSRKNFQMDPRPPSHNHPTWYKTNPFGLGVP